jgi:hypothetical protein
MGFYTTAGHPKRIHTDNLAVKQRQPFFTLRYYYWFKRSVAASRRFDTCTLILKQNRLFRMPVPIVSVVASNTGILFISWMLMSQLQELSD